MPRRSWVICFSPRELFSLRRWDAVLLDLEDAVRWNAIISKTCPGLSCGAKASLVLERKYEQGTAVSMSEWRWSRHTWGIQPHSHIEWRFQLACGHSQSSQQAVLLTFHLITCRCTLPDKSGRWNRKLWCDLISSYLMPEKAKQQHRVVSKVHCRLFLSRSSTDLDAWEQAEGTILRFGWDSTRKRAKSARRRTKLDAEVVLMIHYTLYSTK